MASPMLMATLAGPTARDQSDHPDHCWPPGGCRHHPQAAGIDRRPFANEVRVRKLSLVCD